MCLLILYFNKFLCFWFWFFRDLYWLVMFWVLDIYCGSEWFFRMCVWLMFFKIDWIGVRWVVSLWVVFIVCCEDYWLCLCFWVYLCLWGLVFIVVIGCICVRDKCCEWLIYMVFCKFMSLKLLSFLWLRDILWFFWSYLL